MATYVDILKNEFPEIDSEVFDYITGERPGLEERGTNEAGDLRSNWAPVSSRRVSPSAAAGATELMG